MPTYSTVVSSQNPSYIYIIYIFCIYVHINTYTYAYAYAHPSIDAISGYKLKMAAHEWSRNSPARPPARQGKQTVPGRCRRENRGYIQSATKPPPSIPVAGVKPSNSNIYIYICTFKQRSESRSSNGGTQGVQPVSALQPVNYSSSCTK